MIILQGIWHNYFNKNFFKASQKLFEPHLRLRQEQNHGVLDVADTGSLLDMRSQTQANLQPSVVRVHHI